ncbi:hypothetical protein SPBR_09067 [Sporothrix brasiliensis 5110]|uniref:Uncharacterized protein n=1 Tax=Sporothrix brasiliensis 5110 TaxID=1398154 RepID=A0A0C2FGL1_9PEZI|nr:uncharacterized protein SPBR_09067 [Sporothrix brasiliensis 5110]KIH90188.1 hypothetical protein SPBR_09067 [Sporothrix brasiliensis 5110]
MRRQTEHIDGEPQGFLQMVLGFAVMVFGLGIQGARLGGASIDILALLKTLGRAGNTDAAVIAPNQGLDVCNGAPSSFG